ncbi:MAG TPA: hypothetical protein PLP17_04405 [Oligoflexia bacterium]|nr:hypothetical protein [Oligoflexia bacterium]
MSQEVTVQRLLNEMQAPEFARRWPAVQRAIGFFSSSTGPESGSASKRDAALRRLVQGICGTVERLGPAATAAGTAAEQRLSRELRRAFVYCLWQAAILRPDLLVDAVPALRQCLDDDGNGAVIESALRTFEALGSVVKERADPPTLRRIEQLAVAPSEAERKAFAPWDESHWTIVQIAARSALRQLKQAAAP